MKYRHCWPIKQIKKESKKDLEHVTFKVFEIHPKKPHFIFHKSHIFHQTKKFSGVMRLFWLIFKHSVNASWQLMFLPFGVEQWQLGEMKWSGLVYVASAALFKIFHLDMP